MTAMPPAAPRRPGVRANATGVLVALNVAAYVWELASGTNLASPRSLYDHGALVGLAVTQDREWWRVVTGAFMHGGFVHLAFNMLALLQFGRTVELELGARRMLAVYAFSLAVSGLAVVVFSPAEVTVGASGAIFGLFGALLAVGVRGGVAGRALLARAVPILVLNLLITFAVPGISQAAHVGGLLAGFAFGFALLLARVVPPGPVVVDTATGEPAQAEYLPPAGAHP